MFGIATKIKDWMANEIHGNVPKSTWFPHKRGIMISKYVKLGENCTIQNNVSIGGKFYSCGRYVEKKHPTIDNNVYVGSGSVIFGDIKIGKYAIIGAGSAVTRDVPEYATVAGNPARILRKVYIEG